MPIDWNSFRTGGAFGGALAQSLLPAIPASGLAPGRRMGPYVVERELARGGMAVVYVARRADGEFEQRVALKWMAPSRDEPALEAMFRRERDILASLEHPGIARLLDGGRSPEGMLWFAMELVEGEPIDRWCAARSSGREARLRLVAELCEALAFAHGRLLLHRDIKPGNVLVDSRGRVRLVDFGIARLADQADLQGHHALTPGFASPEQLRGEPTTVASDVYQVGLLLALLLGCVRAPVTGTHATQADGVQAGTAISALPDAAMAGVPAPLASIVRRATALRPDGRYAGVDALRDDLERLLENRPVRAHQGSFAYALRCLLRRQPLASAAVVLAFLAVAGGMVFSNLARIEARQSEARALDARRTAEETTAFLLSIFRAPDPRNNPGLDLTARELLERGISGIDRLGAEPLVQARLLGAFGEVAWSLGDYPRSRSLLERAIALHGSHPGQPLAERVVLLDRLGALLRDQAQFDEAIATFRRALDLLVTAGEGGGMQAAGVYNNLGIAYRRSGRVDEAAEALGAALRLRAALGAPPEASILVNLGTVEQSRGRFSAARERYLEGERALPADMPANHPQRAIIAANLALAARQLGRLGIALADSRRADAIEKTALGPRHPDRAETLQGLAGALSRLGRFEEATAALDEGLACVREGLGDAHPRALPLLTSRAQVASLSGRPVEAMADLDAALALLDRLPAAQASRARATALRLRSATLRRGGDPVAAGAAADASAAAARQAGLDGDRAIALLHGALAREAQGDRAAARANFDAAVQAAGCADAPCRLDQADSLAIRAQWHAANGDIERAFATLEHAIAHPQWTQWMLSLDGLDALRVDPRWARAEERLRARLDRDGGAAPEAGPAGR